MGNSFTLNANRRRDIPDGIWAKCQECGEIIYNGELDRNLRICPKCRYHFPLDPAHRIALLVDEDSFLRYNDAECPDEERCSRTIITGETTLYGHRLVLTAINLNFTDSAIGLFICEKVIGAIEKAIEKRLPFLSVYTNGNDRAFFPAQTLSVSAALSRLNAEKLIYISVLSLSSSQIYFPSYAYAADIVIAESNVLGASRTGSRIGRRETDRSAQMLFQNGLVDMIVPRIELKQKLADVLSFFC